MQDFATVDGVKVPKSDFGYAPGDKPSEWKFPLHDKKHVDSAIDMFGHEKGMPESAVNHLYHMILERGKKFGVDADKLKRFEERHKSMKASEGLRVYVALAELNLGESLIRMPVTLTGKFVKQSSGQRVDIDAPMLEAICSNFSKEPNGVNVDYDHASESELQGLLGPSPSAGKLVKLDAPEPFLDTGRKILWGYFEPTDRARELIKNREYRGVSAAIAKLPDRTTGESQGWTLTSVALTNRPVIREMPEIRLSENGFELMDSSAVHIPGNISEPASAGKGGTLKNYKVKKLADGEHKGKHGIFDADGTLMGLAQMEPDADDAKKASEAFLSEIGAAGKTLEQVKSIVAESGAAQNDTAKLSEIIGTDGRFDRAKLRVLLNTGAVQPGASLLATDTESRVMEAFRAGNIHPQSLQAATRLALADEDAFKTFVEEAKPLVDPKERGTAGVAGAGAANLAWQQALEKKASDLLNAKRPGDPEDALRLAERELTQTEDGLKLYEMARKERLEEAERASR